jgi:hypothetical protein
MLCVPQVRLQARTIAYGEATLLASSSELDGGHSDGESNDDDKCTLEETDAAAGTTTETAIATGGATAATATATGDGSAADAADGLGNATATGDDTADGTADAIRSVPSLGNNNNKHHSPGSLSPSKRPQALPHDATAIDSASVARLEATAMGASVEMPPSPSSPRTTLSTLSLPANLPIGEVMRRFRRGSASAAAAVRVPVSAATPYIHAAASVGGSATAAVESASAVAAAKSWRILSTLGDAAILGAASAAAISPNKNKK